MDRWTQLWRSLVDTSQQEQKPAGIRLGKLDWTCLGEKPVGNTETPACTVVFELASGHSRRLSH